MSFVRYDIDGVFDHLLLVESHRVVHAKRSTVELGIFGRRASGGIRLTASFVSIPFVKTCIR